MSRLYTAANVKAAVAKLPRVKLANIPTPLQYCKQLSREYGVNLYIKRDDLTGLALGGNKTRNLEFRMAEAVNAGADILLFVVEISSNSARQTTAAANMLGLDIILLLRGDPNSEVQGNLLVNHILGANVILKDVSSTKVLEDEAVVMAEELRRQGRRPFILNHAPMFATASAIGYVDSTLEVLEQLEAMGGGKPSHLYMLSGSKGHAGHVLINKALGLGMKTVAISASFPKEDRQAATAKIANQAAETLGLDVTIEPGEIESYGDYVGEGYGIPTPEGIAVIKEVARKEGVILDPVYTGKGMVGLLDHIKKGIVPQGSTVVFVHTGGQPAIFTHAKEFIKDEPLVRQ